MRKFRFAIIDVILFLATVDTLLMTIAAAAVDSNDQKLTVVGDMLLSDNQLKFLYATDEKTRPANPFLLWPNATFFYEFDKSLDQRGRDIIVTAMSYIANVSCVQFVESRESGHYVLIKQGNGCSSEVGMRHDGQQQMIIDGNLCTKGSVIHELLHSLGLLHMHMTKGRDKFIDINWENIRDDAQLNFKAFTTHVNMFNTEYDFDSITHYSRNAFAKNKSISTIIAKQIATNMGQRKEMSIGDITRLNRMYECPNFQNTQNNDENSETEQQEEIDDNDDEEGDMILSEEQIEAMYSTNAAKRNGFSSAFHHWPQAVVPFEIDKSYPPQYVSNIHGAMNHIMNRSCIQFMPRTVADKNFVYIRPPQHTGGGCSSEVGMKRSGVQTLLLNETICSRGKIIHELLHSLGFFHMHTANDRDNYISINWENVKERAKANFVQMTMHVSMFSTPYDYDSIMHYSTKAFAKKRGIKTIIPLQHAPNMGQRIGMSEGDIIRLNRMYKCKAIPTTTTATIAPKLSTTEPGVESSTVKTDKTQQQQPKTLFGMLIFKIVGKN
ncbi:hypothetical protein PVAND_009350 [Polypedilum vanderplanki]|uniref:Metalloendopeptidase n=1 Tax=Polypedilum vanderplanki TaxID=319348 RepID=A0A9J6CCG7_POLVA|nr:hypothetical protein PVAND_009350 [Polypedilum vanderplanki]